jgi:hypothetical protein
MDVNQVDELSRKFFDVAREANVDKDVAFAALQMVFVYWMACVCPDCRRGIAHKLKADIPRMLETANKGAAMSPEAPQCHCHRH